MALVPFGENNNWELHTDKPSHAGLSPHVMACLNNLPGVPHRQTVETVRRSRCAVSGAVHLAQTCYF